MGKKARRRTQTKKGKGGARKKNDGNSGNNTNSFSASKNDDDDTSDGDFGPPPLLAGNKDDSSYELPHPLPSPDMFANMPHTQAFLRDAKSITKKLMEMQKKTIERKADESDGHYEDSQSDDSEKPPQLLEPLPFKEAMTTTHAKGRQDYENEESEDSEDSDMPPPLLRPQGEWDSSSDDSDYSTHGSATTDKSRNWTTQGFRATPYGGEYERDSDEGPPPIILEPLSHLDREKNPSPIKTTSLDKSEKGRSEYERKREKNFSLEAYLSSDDDTFEMEPDIPGEWSEGKTKSGSDDNEDSTMNIDAYHKLHCYEEFMHNPRDNKETRRFDRFASFLKFPPLGYIEDTLSSWRPYVCYKNINDPALRQWARDRLEYVSNRRKHGDLNSVQQILEKNKYIKEKDRQKRVTDYAGIAPAWMTKSMISLVLHLQKYDEFAMDRLIDRLHYEPLYVDEIKTLIENDRNRRKSLIPVKKCANCGIKAMKGEKLKYCMQCFTVGYCNATCQKSHWSMHKASCQFIDDLPVSNEESKDESDPNLKASLKLKEAANLILEKADKLSEALKEFKKEQEADQELEKIKKEASSLQKFLKRIFDSGENINEAHFNGLTASEAIVRLFDSVPTQRLWLHLTDDRSSDILKFLFRNEMMNLLDKETQSWLLIEAESILKISCDECRLHDVNELIAGHVPVRPKLLQHVFDKRSKIPRGFVNSMCLALISVTLDDTSEANNIKKPRFLGKNAWNKVLSAIENGKNTLNKKKALSKISGGQDMLKKDNKEQKVISISSDKKMPSKIAKSAEPPTASKTKTKLVVVPQYRKDFYVQYDELIKKFQKKFDELLDMDSDDYIQLYKLEKQLDGLQIDKSESKVEAEEIGSFTANVDVSDFGHREVYSVEEADEEMAKCFELEDEGEQEKIVERVASRVSFENWGEDGDDSEWVVEITEQAFKWFRKRSKKSRWLVTRVLGRLKLLSTGRWPYVLKKPLKTRRGDVNLYESKIDAGSRIIWEIAVTFSPRRSTMSESFCEQVVRVWDIVEDHDDLTRAIDRTVDRILKSRKRGEECMISADLDASPLSNANGTTNACSVPNVYRMMSGMKTRNQNEDIKGGSTKYYPPASDDDYQYTLLKFYALNTQAVEQLLATDVNELPFSPGPKEYEIIQHKTTPPRPILLMGRSGTGKTTCLVFRMWSQYMAYANAPKGTPRPRQMFLTKNNVLKSEVRKAFFGMGNLWKKSIGEDSGEEDFAPNFFSSVEWLELLDATLPGERFFSKAEKRLNTRSEDEIVNRMVSSLNESKNVVNVRKELTYSIFRDLWPRIVSKTICDFDPALVYIEIKSYIKGSVYALHLDSLDGENAPKYLDREEYLSLPKKMSRMDKNQREIIYSLFERYEQLKKDENYYDEMDLVVNIARRANRYKVCAFKPRISRNGFVIPLDSVFVDEVQDFTQVELFLLVTLSKDPNNLMLAGDTAQSIAVGVGFRFTDVKQIFYEHFQCIEPSLLQLVHNYRSHVGVLKLASCVVELLYFFFSDSLDTLPPDQGLFPGPKPLLIEVANSTELVLMMNGSKRETSRIEFGAHQVILVRNEAAKRKIPDNLVSDKDWIMTVQESKGLEFDDVLLYNFFSDSDARDLWRIVGNYSEDKIREFFEKLDTDASGTRCYEWHDIEDLKATRHLDFQRESHKVLESELKILYTAITRARVNIFVAEDDMKAAQPMYNYFLRRGAVETVDKNSKDVSSRTNIFKENDCPSEAWLMRGTMFLRHVENLSLDQSKIQYLRLAKKCFLKCGDITKVNKIDAEIAYAELEQDISRESINVRRRKQVNLQQDQKKIYGVTIKLMETQDEACLAKAGICLLALGSSEAQRSALAFELSANLSYVTRQIQIGFKDFDIEDLKPNESETRSLRHSAQLLQKCLQNEDSDLTEPQKRDYMLRRLRCLLTSSNDIDLANVNDILSNNRPSVYYLATELGKMLHAPPLRSSEAMCSSLRYFYWRLLCASDEPNIKSTKKNIMSTIEDACRYFMKNGNVEASCAAIEAVPDTDSRDEIAKRVGLGHKVKC